MEGDLIFVNTDPGVTIGLEALKELEDEERLEEMNQQTAWLSAIQSNVIDNNNDDKNNIFKFGKVTEEEHAFAFGKTASAVFRMVMLHAVQIEDTVWPKSKNTTGRNRKALKFVVSKQIQEALQLDKKKVQLYYEKYDQVFPPSLISRKLLTNKEKPVSFHNKMLIFRNYFTDVIIIETTANATMYPPVQLGWEPDEIFCDVRVTCTRKVIKPEDGKYFKNLKELHRGAGQEQAQPMTRTRDEVLALLYPEDEESNSVEDLTTQTQNLSVS